MHRGAGRLRASVAVLAVLPTVLLGVVAVAGVPASAGTVTQANACTWLTGEQVPMDVTVSGSATPASPAYLDTITLSSVAVSGTMPWWAATVAYEAGLIDAGPNTVPLTVRLAVGATNAEPASQLVVASTTASVNFNPDLPFTAAGQAGQLIKVTNLAMPSSTWVRTGQQSVAFRQHALTVRATLGSLVDQPVLTGCFPAVWSTDDVPIATPVTPTPFAQVGSTLPNPRFSDVPYGHPFFLDVEWVAAEGIADGYPDGTFRPTTAVSRQAFASFLHKAAGSPTVARPGSPSFSDVSFGHAFSAAIEWAHQQGIIAGYGDGTFRPTAPVSRQAAAQWVMLATADFAAVPSQAPFPDVPLSHPFVTAIAWLDDQEIASGYPDGTFRPGATVSRQAAAAWLHRAGT